MNMNMNTNMTLKLFLLTASAVVFNNNAVSAFVAPSATTCKRQVLTVAAARRQQNLVVLQVATADSIVDDDTVNGASWEDPDSIDDIQSAIEVMEKLQKGETGAIPDDHFDGAKIKPRKPVCTDMEDDDLDGAVLKELAESEESNNALDRPIDFLKNLMKGYRYIKRRDGKIEYASYPRHYDNPDLDLSWLMKMMKGAPPPEYLFSKRKIGRLVKFITPFLLSMQVTKRKAKKSDPEDMYEDLFTKYTRGIPKNKRLMKHWEEDKEFARQFIAGLNPVMVSVGKNLSQLTDSLVSKLGKDDLQGLIDEKRLFVVDYDELIEFASPPPSGYEREFYAPVVVLELNKERTELDVMGIQLDRTDDAKVYTKDDGDEWLYAKTHVASADSNVHEWVSHLGKTHLAFEPHIIAIHNTLKMKNHALAPYFAPLVKDTLFLNWAARKSLANYATDEKTEGSTGDLLSSIGVSQYMQINRKWWKSYDFFKSSGLPTELESRGFDKDFDMPCYLFREDGMKLWDAYGEFASNYVDEIYHCDADVAKDDVVQEWAEETTAMDKGAVPGFPTVINDKATLVKIMQTLMWVPSGLHAAMNFPQYDYYSYVPNKPLFTKAKKANPSRKDVFDKVMPDLGMTIKTMQLTRVLTIPSETCIDDLDDNFAEVGEASYKKLKSKLDTISDEIEDRNVANKNKGAAVYSYLNPAVVPASIDI